MAKTLEDMKIGILFAIGGDGTLRGAQVIAEEATRRGMALSVIGIPKTIDNDVSFVQKTFGFETAVAEARRAIYAANTEAESARNGIRLVKLMGRDSGFIAAYRDLQDFFGSVDHEKLLTLLSQRVADSRVLRLIKAMLKAGSYGHGKLFPSERGTPQGGVASPLLSNILLTRRRSIRRCDAEDIS
jgi:6-phosphofructokinase